MRMTWRQFQCYLEAYQWVGNQYSDDGKRDNLRFDLEYTKGDSRLKDIKQTELAKANAALAKIRERRKKAPLQ